MLQWRLLAAACILGPLFVLIWLDDQVNGGRPGIWLGPLAVVVSLMAAHELNRLFAAGNRPCWPLANLAAVFCVTSLSLLPVAWLEYPQPCPVGKLGWTALGAAAGSAILFVIAIIQYQKPGDTVPRLAAGHLALVYVGVLTGMLIQLRLMLPGRLGLLAVIVTIMVVKLADAGAFFVGKAVGRTKFTAVSPGKTLEGCFGGLLFAGLGAWFARDVLLPWLAPAAVPGPYLGYFGFAACMMILGLVGDLAESLLKREAGVKDSSTWLPGLGGVLDVVDSLIFVAPASFMWWASGMLLLPAAGAP